MKNCFSRIKLSLNILIISFLIQFLLFGNYTVTAQSITNPTSYETFIKQADNAFNRKDYPTALLNYEKARQIKPEQAFAKNRIAEINSQLDATPELRSTLFEEIIIIAESNFKQKNYSVAKQEFQKALVLDPTSQFAKDRITQIGTLYTDPDDQAYYTNALTNGDQALAKQEFEKALQYYESALSIKPGEKNIKDKIATTKKLQVEFTVKKEQSQKIVAAADNLYKAGKLPEAKAEYQKALDLLPGNTYASQKIQEIDKFDTEKKANQDNYDRLIEQADQFYINRDFASAQVKYNESLKYKPGARYPKEMIEKTKTGESQLLSEQQRYDAAITSADNLFTTGDFESALIGYKSALAIKPTEVYPKTKITEIEKNISESKSRREAYEIAIKNGDQAFDEKKYTVALGHYLNSLTLLPGEKYPTQKTEEINTLLAKQKEIDENYSKSIAEADKQLKLEKYDEAIAAYNKALEFKPEESYPKQKIADAQAKQTASANKKESYAIAIANGDRLFSEYKYNEALQAYELARSINSFSEYPISKISEINFLYTKYTKAIEKGNKAQAAGDLNQAMLSFEEALKIKPTDQATQDKINEIKATIETRQLTNEKYAAAIKTGDQLLASKEYDAAIAAYAEASELKKNEKYPKDQLLKIEKIQSEQRSANENYSTAILEGDNYFNSNKFTEALASYKKATAIRPAETYPKTQIDKINSLIANQKKIDTEYAGYITEADKLLTGNKFDDAIVSYRKASELKPTEKYPLEKIAEAEKKNEELKNLLAAYDKNIAEADQFFAEKNYPNALTSYKNASSLKPTEAYPKQKVIEIQAILDKDKALEQRYQEAITQADKLLSEQKNTVALEIYQKAATIKPGEKYPLEQIEKINLLLAEQKKLDENYQKLINDANTLFQSAKYHESKTVYSNASALKPAETHPKEKIAEIDRIITDLQNKEQNFAKYISEGDGNFAEKKYSEAITSYSSALKIKPADSYAKEQIEKANTLLAEIKKKDADYLLFITTADKLQTEAKYEDAVVQYQKALDLKPNEKYPSDKINEINKLIVDLKKLQEAYDKSIAEGNNYLQDKNYTTAITAFKEASSLKPKESYPKQKIAEIQAILDNDKAETQRYQEAITEADKLFNERKNSPALEAYQKALIIKPAEKYPQEQIEKIKLFIAEQQKLDEEYKKLLADAENNLKENKLAEARILFQKASSLKPVEKLPVDKIAEIDGRLAVIQQREQDYTQAIKEGDMLLSEKKYPDAITSYQKALSIKSDESYPRAQIDKINVIIADQKKLDDNYLAALTAADQLFEVKKYSDAIISYRKAISLKPTETYPAGKIKEAENQISILKTQQDTYDKAIADGDKKFALKDYENALIAYNTAKTAKPDESYPSQKINETLEILSKIKAKNDRYNEAIALGDKFFTAQKYREALEPYEGASTIKPTEKYPQEQIVKINQLLSEQKKLDDEYQSQITLAEAQFNAKKYAEARSMYTKAETLKPTETLPKEKIAEIDRIMADLKMKDENFNKAINSAGEAYIVKNYTDAIRFYEEALTIKPAEKLPQEKITAIKAEVKLIEDNYQKAITQGDTKLSSNNLMEALNAYQNALEIKPGEKYPQNKITEINNLLAAQQEEQEKMYNSFITEGDQLIATKDYSGARSAFSKAGGIKPNESYPKQKLAEIKKITEEIELARKAEYQKALGEADKLYNSKVFDLAIDAYETASKINPDDTYPQIQISKIRKYMVDHAVQDISSQTITISEGNENKFSFNSIEPRLRKNNYILMKARSTGKNTPKVYLSYGKDNQKNGSIVLRSIDKNTISDLIIRISVQDKWYREDNNWISLFVETGDIEITRIQITAGEE